MCSDPSARFYPQREVCYASMEREAANAKWQALHDERPWHDGTWMSWAKERSSSHPYHRDHGVTIGVSATDLRPDDKFLSDVECGPPDTSVESQMRSAEEEPSGASECAEEAQ